MSLLNIILLLAILGLIWYLVVTYIPPMKTIITLVVIIALFLLHLAGIGDARVVS